MKKEKVISGFLLMAFLVAILSGNGLANDNPTLIGGSAESSLVNSVTTETYLADHVMGIYPPPDPCYRPAEYYYFYSTDSIMNWTFVTDMKGGQKIKTIWYAPDGSQYESNEVEAPYDGNWCWTTWWPKGFPNIHGTWWVAFLIDGTEYYWDDFHVTAYFWVGVSVRPEKGGSATGAGINCGSDCWEPFWYGTEITLKANPNYGWKFLYWYNGSTYNYSQSITFTVTNFTFLVTNFFLGNSTISLFENDTESLGERQPLILVHGNGSEEKDGYLWEDFIREAKSDSDFDEKYKIYIFRWDSKESNLYNGLALGYAMEIHNDFFDRKVTILAHSRGGLVARFFMNYHRGELGKFDGKRSGEKVDYLVTLATPHRGSPGADPMWVKFALDYSFSKKVAKFLSYTYFRFVWDEDSHTYLTWDDWDNELTNKEFCWESSLFGENFCAFLMTNTSLLKLNKEDRYKNKVIAYGGNNYKKDWVVTMSLSDIETQALEHTRLDAASILLAKTPGIPNGYPETKIDDAFRPYQANDGLVPLSSALFLKPGSGGVFKVDKKGALVYSTSDLRKFVQVKEAIILKPSSYQVDHLDFLDNSGILSVVVEKLKKLR